MRNHRRRPQWRKQWLLRSQLQYRPRLSGPARMYRADRPAVPHARLGALLLGCRRRAVNERCAVEVGPSLLEVRVGEVYRLFVDDASRSAR